jgi:hypothetical protein
MFVTGAQLKTKTDAVKVNMDSGLRRVSDTVRNDVT